MKKKIIALLLALVMMLGLVPVAAFATGSDGTDTATFTVTPDKTEAKAGDVITYTLTLDWEGKCSGYAFRPVFPAGLEYVAGSGAVNPDGKAALNFDDFSYTESSKIFSGYGLPADKPSAESFELGTFQAKVLDTAAAGDYKIDSDSNKIEAVNGDYDSFAITNYECGNVKVVLEPLSTFTLTADKTTVTRGEIINYTLTVDWVGKCSGYGFRPVFPAGLEYVAGSGKENPDGKAALNFDDFAFTEVSKFFSGYGLPADKPSNKPLELGTFQVKVADDADFKEYSLGSDENKLEFVDGEYEAHPLDRVKFVSSTITVVDHTCTADKLTFVEAKDATCTEDGNIAYYVCECGLFYADADAKEELAEEDVIIPAAHTEGDWVETTAPTCTDNGVETLYCSVCGEELDTREVEAKGHDYKSVVTAPTCTDRGYTTHTCSVCGDTYTDNYVPANGHTDGEWVETTAPTCTEKGEETLYCSVCDAVLDTREVEANGHTDGEWVETTAPTCTEKGEETLYCSVCDAVLNTREVEAKGHDYESVVTAPTCTEDGYTTHTCKRNCGEEGDVVVDTPVPALGHDEGIWKHTTLPTCTEGGLDSLHCTRCDVVLETRGVEAKGHKEGDWVETTAPTCTEKGEEKLYCTVCGEELNAREVEAKGHSYESVVTAPTCTEDGYTTWTCSVCGDSYKDTIVPATGHSIPEKDFWVENPDEPGWYYGYCANGCGYYENELRTIFVDGVALSADYYETYYKRSAPAFTLTAYVTPEDATEDYTVTWSSSDESVITIDEDGNVTTHKRGSAVVTVTVEKEDGTTKEFSATIKVKYNWWQWLIWIFLLGCCWYFI